MQTSSRAMLRPACLHAGALATALVVASGVTGQSLGAQQRALLRTAAAASRPGPSDLRLASLGIAVPVQPPRQHSDGARMALQFLAAGAGALVVGIATDLALHDVSPQRVKGDEGYTRSGNVGYLVGSFAGATFGAQAVGNAMGARAPLWATSLGALAGTIPLAALGIDEPCLPLFGIALGWIPQAAFATAGYTMARTH